MFNFTIDKKPTKKKIELLPIYDLIVIGAGPAGANASLYAKRKGMEVLMISSETGGQLLSTNLIENYLGLHSITGEDLNKQFIEHVESIDVPIMTGVLVESIVKTDNLFSLKLSDSQIVKSKTVAIATGANPRKLNVKGEQNLIGKGVSYCAICDGPFYKDKDVAVIGGGNSALETVIDLAKIANSITVVQLEDDFTADKVLVDQVKSLPNVTCALNSSAKEIIGTDKVKALKYFNNSTKKEHTVNVDGIFIEIGVIPNSSLVKDLVDLNKFNEVITDKYQRTSLSGMYAIGDVTDYPYKQIITAASQGAVAALSANDYINRKEN